MQGNSHPSAGLAPVQYVEIVKNHCCPAALFRVWIHQGSSIARDMRTSIHRCLVFLGDLSRYASQAAPKAAAATAVTAAGSSTAANTAAKAEWSKAVGYYRMAAHVLPRSGNPHNQLAVMAFMTGEELKAAYHYARSLCVHVPFMTARENLLQLLQNNRDR